MEKEGIATGNIGGKFVCFIFMCLMLINVFMLLVLFCHAYFN